MIFCWLLCCYYYCAVLLFIVELGWFSLLLLMLLLSSLAISMLLLAIGVIIQHCCYWQYTFISVASCLLFYFGQYFAISHHYLHLLPLLIAIICYNYSIWLLFGYYFIICILFSIICYRYLLVFGNVFSAYRSTGHVVGLGGGVDDLVDGLHGKVHGHELHHRHQPREGCAHADACKACLRDGRVDHPLGPPLGQQPLAHLHHVG